MTTFLQYEAVQQLMLYINMALGAVLVLAVFTWQITSYQIAHEDDPNKSASLEVRRINGVKASIIATSMLGIITTLNLFV